jgi:chromosome segregation ATPase
MASFFKKALGVFVEFDESSQNVTPSAQNTSGTPMMQGVQLNSADIDKFEAHFDKLFEQSNFAGPDYFEFCKMMETLEAHIPDENARISATFAALSIQGLTKQKLVETAEEYKKIIKSDKTKFESVLTAKSEVEVGQRKKKVEELEKKMVANSEMIQKLTKEISEAQTSIAALKNEIMDQESKLSKSRNGYAVACDALVNKITQDITKIQTGI